ncbi:sigma-54-dependent Fis family transcriptional regulator [Sodalis ligni]|uniref:Nif-specific regulatory protein n=1 Tax=Sodalis ligni TaxID=2697027 RepID=A0A4R1N4F1_9GAMM|nr:sigma 54-interacting transcriptional regulator [Sodalis ligni]TCL02044.1 Nif-specific regulatory protein [Sodalis ligni]
MKRAFHQQVSSARAALTPDVHVNVDWAQHELFFRREMAKIYSRYTDTDQNLREVFHLLSEILGLNRGRLFIYDDNSGLLSIRCAYGLTEKEKARGILRPDEGVTGKVFVSGQMTIVQDIDSEPTYLWRSVARSAMPSGTTSMFFFPIVLDGKTRGVFCANRFRGISRNLTADIGIMHEVVGHIGQMLRVEELIAERVQTHTVALEHENRALRQALKHDTLKYGIYGDSVKVRTAIRQIEQVAASDVTVLLVGESGTGKELFANALHIASRRAEGKYIKMNCAAVPESLFESELFGHEKGAFTGAMTAKAGQFEQADNGTLFLDEISELPLNLQAKLLRVLQEKTIQRIGGRERAVNVRIIAATNQDLRQRVAEGRFRLDLFYRLYVVPIFLPSLRDRPEDIPILIQHFIEEANVAFQRRVHCSGDALAALIRYSWPGNVRQLQNVVNRLVLLSESPLVDAAEVAPILANEEGTTSAPAENPAPEPEKKWMGVPAARIEADDAQAILQALRQSDGNKSRAAQKLGLTLSQLVYRLRKFGLTSG